MFIIEFDKKFLKVFKKITNNNYFKRLNVVILQEAIDNNLNLLLFDSFLLKQLNLLNKDDLFNKLSIINIEDLDNNLNKKSCSI